MTRRRPLEWMANLGDELGPGSAFCIGFHLLSFRATGGRVSRGSLYTLVGTDEPQRPWTYLVPAGSFSYELVT